MSKTWLITGASSGFGRLLTERVAAAGDHVLAVARRGDRLSELASLAPARITPLALDLTSDQAGSAIHGAIRRAGGVHVLVNNAGYGLFATVEQSDDETARALFETNFFAGLTVLRAALPALRASKGRIVQISSYLGQLAWPGSGLYSASKSAVELVSDALAVELASAGVRVSTIQPGVFGTEFSASAHIVVPSEAYATTVGGFLKTLSALKPDDFGDPDWVVEAVLAVVAHPKPPLRLAVGSDAVEGIRNALQTQLGEMAEWESISIPQGLKNGVSTAERTR
jgi:NAD(P)-dependent dehydrogenase (short-subunit alcohol dehydrogenase family)